MQDVPGATAAALLDAWVLLGERLPFGWSERVGPAAAIATGIPAPTLNGVWCAGHADPAGITRLLNRVAATGLPHCLQFPTGTTTLAVLAMDRGLRRIEDIPLMRLDARPTGGPSISAGRASTTGGFAIRRLAPSEARLHARIAAAGFQAPEGFFTPLVGPEIAEERSVTCYIGEVGGRPVTTGLAVRAGDHVGVFNVATPPEQRGRGFGSAITAGIVADAVAGEVFGDGARWAWLQSSAAGHGVYRRLGFVDIAIWECWVAG